MAKPGQPMEKTDRIPPGAKQVTQTTVERYVAPIDDPEPEPEDFAPAAVGTLPDDDEPEDPPELSAIDLCLLSIRDGDEHVVYVRRRPDPVGISLQFQQPSNREYTVGELPFDETFTCQDAIELAVQSAFKGGLYQIQIRRRGQVVKSWTRLIADPPERREAALAVMNYNAVPNVGTPFENFKAQAVEFAETARALGLGPPRGNGAPAHIEPADPIRQLEESFDRVDKWKDRLGLSAPTTVVAGGERSWVTDLAQLSQATGLTDGFKEFAGPVGKVLGVIIAQKIADTWSAATEAAVNGDAKPGTAPNTATAAPAAQNGTAAQQPAPSEYRHPPQVMPLLTKIVEDLERNTDVDASVNATVAMVETVRKLPGDTFKNVMAYVDGNILQRSPVEVALWLARGNHPAWEHLLRLTHVAHWINEFQQELYAALNPNAELAGEPEDESESTTLDLSNLEPAGSADAGSADILSASSARSASSQKGDNHDDNGTQTGTDRQDQPDGRREQSAAAGGAGAAGAGGGNRKPNGRGAKNQGEVKS